MGDALVVANVPEEAFMLGGLCDYANGKAVPLADLYRTSGSTSASEKEGQSFYGGTRTPSINSRSAGAKSGSRPRSRRKSTVTAGTKTVTPAASTQPPFGRASSDS